MEYSLVYKTLKNMKFYVSGFDGFGQPMHSTKESDAYRFYDLLEALKYYNFGYGIETRVLAENCEEGVKQSGN